MQMNLNLNLLQSNITLFGFSVMAAALPMIAFFRARAIVPIAILVILIGLTDQYRRTNLRIPVDYKSTAILVAIVLWALLSTIWAPDFHISLRGTGKLFGNFMIGILLLGLAIRLRDECPPKALGFALTAGVIITLTAMTIDGLIGQPISNLFNYRYDGNIIGLYWLNASTAILIILIWPVIHFLESENKRILWISLLIWLAWVTNLVGFNTGLVVLGVALLLFIPLFFLNKLAHKVLIILLIVGTFSSPFLIPRVLDPAVFAPIKYVSKPAVHRMYIWKFTSNHILEKPITGWGMNAARSIPGGKNITRDKYRQSYGENLPLHPHNVVLQIWLELGLPGVTALTFLLSLLLFKASALGLTRWSGTLLLMQFMSILLFSGASFGVWQSWFQVLLWFNLSLAVLIYRPALPSEPPPAA
jgi:exopolysaccharide production protein ExoQ